MKNPIKLLAMAMTLLLAMVSSTVSAASGNYDEYFSQGVIRATGAGVPNPKFPTRAQQKLSARDAAKAAAYAELLAAVKGVTVEGNVNVENYMTENQEINLTVSGMVRGAQVENEEWDSDGICYVTMVIPMYGPSSISSAVLQRPAYKEPIPEPVKTVAPSPVTTTTTTTTTTTVIPSTIIPSGSVAAKPSLSSGAVGGYTGVIIDCSGLGLKPVMSPVIKNADGQKIYGHKNLNYDLVIEKGMAGYSKGMSDLARAGSNPLILKAISVEDHNANPVLSTADANRLLVENGATGFLDNLNVVFIR